MQRWLTRILICLLLGAVTTVAVAWGSALSVGFADTLPGVTGTRMWSGGLWGVETYSRTSAVRVSSFQSARSGETGAIGPEPASLLPVWFPSLGSLEPDQTARGFDVEARGWPSVALWSVTRDWIKLSSNALIDQSGRYAFVLPLDPFSGGMGDIPKVLPLRPLWLGFLIDTLFYGALWFGSFFGFGAARRGLRKKRGRCPMCGYDLRGGLPQAGRLCHPIQGCPECGWNRRDDQRRDDVQPPGEAGG